MDDDFVEERERARREWAFVHGGAEIRWNAVWRRRIVEWVRKQQALGKVVPELAARLGIRVTQLRGWLYARTPWQPSDEEADRPPLRPVQIVAEKVRIPDGVPERRYAVRLRAGVIVRDLTLVEVTEVLRSLV
jgi:hypothetical protein